MKNMNTKDALNYLVNILYEEIDRSTPIAFTYLDLVKAFDCANRKLLLHKLYYYEYRGNAHKQPTSYLYNKHQRVKLEQYYSSSQHLQWEYLKALSLVPSFS